MRVELTRNTHRYFMPCMFEKNICFFFIWKSIQNEIQGYNSENVGYQPSSLMWHEGEGVATLLSG